MAEITLPRHRLGTLWVLTLSTIVAVFCVLAVVDLVHGDAVLPSVAWLALVALALRASCREAGGTRAYAANIPGEALGRQFAEASVTGEPPGELRLGYELRDRRTIRRTIRLRAIRSVEWSTGQATAMAGRDRGDWSVALWHDRPADAEPERWESRPGQEICVVGPQGRREDTEALGLALVALFREAGIPLTQGETGANYVRESVG
ncbi:MAG TPA: hypothetical protein VGN26_04440 [Armatimonadota bacterium]|jgi:hypothetical protein